MVTDVHIDHIDPKWSEGRDYQLVCGLNNVHNMCERDSLLNMSKANRFLPWRNCHDEIGSDPVDPGDLCLFLDPDTHEWVLEEFMGDWWYEKTRRFAGCAQPPTDQTKRKIADALKGVKHTAERVEKQRVTQKARMNDELRERSRAGALKQAARRRLTRMSFTDPLCPNFEY